jgi:hypothetical protein
MRPEIRLSARLSGAIADGIAINPFDAVRLFPEAATI